MEKQSFESLARQAFRRSGEDRLQWLMVLGLLTALAMFVPFLAVCGYIVYAAVAAKEAGTQFPFAVLLWAVPVGLLCYIAAAWLSAALWCGIARETLEEPPSCAGRAFKAGFARWLTVLYPLPWVIGAGIASAVVQGAVKLSGNPLTLAALPMLLNFAIGIVTAFMYAAVAVEAPRVGITTLYDKVIRAVRNGWIRMLLGQLVIAGASIVGLLLCLPSVLCIVLGKARDHRTLLLTGCALLVIWLALMIALWIRLFAFQFSYNLRLYVDATREDAPTVPEDPGPEA